MESAPEFLQTPYYSAAQSTPEKRLSDAKNGDQFLVEDLLNIPADENMVSAADGGVEAAMTGNSTDSAVTAADASCNSSFSTVSTAEPHFNGPVDICGGPRCSSAGDQFSSELCVPYDDLAELEWLSNFVEESSFSSEDLEKLQPNQATKARPEEASEINQYQLQPETGPIMRPDVSVPAKARSKRSRAAPGNWTSRLLVVSPTPSAMSSSSNSDIIASAVAKKAAKTAVRKKKEGTDNSAGGEGRKCLHCAAEKTPQWRTGPLGPKTLCNACGVRYKSGRLVPEYRPAASPTFVLTKHSNSHRKVLELRRQKELLRPQQQQQHQQYLSHQNATFDLCDGDDYLIHQHIGPDFRQLI